jgi:hypothetical protein
MQPVSVPVHSPPLSPTFAFYFNCLILFHFLLGDIFFHVDPTFSALDETVKDLPNKAYSPVESSIANEGHFFRSFSDLTVPREKAEALLPILAIACLGLNSSKCLVNKHLLQTVFGTALFFNRTKLLNFPIYSRSSSHNYFTPQAMAHLHGKRLMDLLTQSEEAFIRFVILVDLMRYHYHSLGVALNKYHNLFSAEEKSSLVDFMTSYQGDRVEDFGMSLPPNRKKAVKGYRSVDISLYIKIKSMVTEDRKNANLLISQMDEAAKSQLVAGDFPVNASGVLPFTFSFAELQSCIKHEGIWERKHHFIPHVKACAMPIECDEDEVFDSSSPPIMQLTI